MYLVITGKWVLEFINNIGGKSFTNARNAFMYSLALPSSGFGNFIRIISLAGHNSLNNGFNTAAITSNGNTCNATLTFPSHSLQKSSRFRYASNTLWGTPHTIVFASTRTSSNSSCNFFSSSSNSSHHTHTSHILSPSSRSGRIWISRSVNLHQFLFRWMMYPYCKITDR